jgi:tetratricopeptide (TPR) repeat protein
MRYVSFLVAAFGLAATEESPDPPLSDTRLPVHTLLREDIFAGFMAKDMDRFARGEKNIETLLEKRPADKPSLLAWKASALFYRAVLAHEAKRNDEFEEKYRQATELFAQARKLGPDDFAVKAIVGGVYGMFADRLPEKLRGEAWSTAYDAYQALWKVQGPAVERLPLHLKGELLAGLAQSAERNGKSNELAEYLDKILAVAPDTSYARVAKKWKDDPKTAKDTRMTCLTCHAPGRLAARQAALGEK